MNVVLLLLHFQLCLRTTSAGHDPPPAYDKLIDNGTFGHYPAWKYATLDHIESPKVNFLQWSPRCDDGSYYFLSPSGWALNNPGPRILDYRGDLIWAKHFDPELRGNSYNLMVQKHQGVDHLAFWLGDNRISGLGWGHYHMLNASYDSVHRIDAANGLSADFHEFYVTPNGTALITMFELVEFNLSQFPGYESASNKSPPSYIWDCLFQEISIDTGGLVFEWRASDHVSVSQTYRRINTQGTRNNPFDWFHINSVQKDEAGHYLISSRYTHSIMYIDGESGAIIWTLGGKGNDFADLSNGNAINFAWQHDARLLPRETFPNMYIASIVPDGLTTKLLTLFDNAADDDSDDYGLPHSRGLVLELIYPARRSNIKYPRQTTHSTCPRRRGVVSDLNAQKIREINGSDPDHTVRVVQSYESPEGTRTHSQGSLQVLPSSDGQDPKILIGWGRNAAWTEYEVNGTILCNAHYGFNVSAGRGDVQNYRIYKMPWIGTPQTRPSGKISENDAEVYVSWNGATDVVQWSLQCSKSDSANDGDWREIARVKKEGFETVIPLSAEVSQSRFLRVIAISENEQRFEFGTTKTMRRSFIATHLPWLSHLLPYKISHSWPLAVLLFMVGAISLTLALYGLARSILRWRSGHVRSSRFNRRNRPVYQPIGRE